MTDPRLQFLILISLSGIGIAVGSFLAVIGFVDKCLGGRPFLRFSAEFAVTTCGGALLWLVIILLNNGVFRLFFILTATVFAVIFFICIQKLLSPRINRAKNALERLRHTRAGSFIVKYILK